MRSANSRQTNDRTYPKGEPGASDPLAKVLVQASTPLLILMGPEHRFNFINASYVRLLRRSSEDSLLGRPIRVALPELEGQGFFELLDEVYRTGEPYVGNEALVRLNSEETGAAEDGYFNFIYQPIRGDQGAVEGIMVQVTDVTPQVLARQVIEEREKGLQRQWSELEAIYLTAPIGLCLLSAKGFRFLKVNEVQSAMIGLPSERILGKSMWEVGPLMAERLEALYRRVVVTGEPIQQIEVEGELPAQPGVCRHWVLSYSPVFAEDGSVDAISCASLEVTAQRRTEKALIKSEKLAAVGRLSSSIAHEINNPLESVMNLIYLTRQVATDVEMQGYLEMADQELRRVSTVVNHTLCFHRQPVKPQAIRCNDLFTAVLNLYERRLKSSSVSVEKRKRARQPVVCFEGDVRQVLNNVVGNAVDAMPRGGRMLIRSREGRDWRTGQRGVVLTVADTGAGIDAVTQRKMFDAFFTTKEVAGTGLGLWISAEIMERHKGWIRIRSSQEMGHRGTVVSLFLPFLGVAA